MDISEFLTTMQSSAPERALARNVMSRGAIPDADNDPRTADAAPADDLAADAPDQDQGGFDTEQYAEGGAVDRLDYESDNIEDRRDEDGGDGGDALEGMLEGQRERTRAMEQDKWSKVSNKLGRLGFDGGGEVPDDEEVTEPVTTGAIPDPNDNVITKNSQQPDDESWRNAALEGVDAGVNYGANHLHAVNRPMNDGTQEGDVASYLGGEGAMDPRQFAAAEQAVDPTGNMDPTSRLQKTIGSVFKFYSEKYGENSQQPDTPAAKAAWSMIQYARKAFMAYGAHATVAEDQGNAEAAAKSAEAALNKIPDGVHAQVRIGREAFNVALSDPETGKPILNRDLTPEQLKHLLTPQGFERALRAGTADAVQRVAQLANGHERVGVAPQSVNPLDDAPPREGLPPRPQQPQQQRASAPPADGLTFGQRLAVANGFPPTMDLSGMTTSQIAQLKRAHQANMSHETPRMMGNDAKIASRERLAREALTSRENIVDKQQAGLNGRLGNAPGQMEGTNRKVLTNAQQDTKDWLAQQRVRPSQEQIDQFGRARVQYWRAEAAAGRIPQEQQPQQPQQKPAMGRGTTQTPTQTKEYNGRTYVFDKQRGGWVAQ